eukprot:scaffold658287_cov74-Prasinocladus_malaysianus.AAC.1
MLLEVANRVDEVRKEAIMGGSEGPLNLPAKRTAACSAHKEVRRAILYSKPKPKRENATAVLSHNS